MQTTPTRRCRKVVEMNLSKLSIIGDNIDVRFLDGDSTFSMGKLTEDEWKQFCVENFDKYDIYSIVFVFGELSVILRKL